jgi:uncharacterized repeat protein (TIGR04138 family)
MAKRLSQFYLNLLEKGEAVYPLAFYTFLFDTIYRTSITEKATAGMKDRSFHLSPEKICSLFSRRAQEAFGKFAGLVLEQWNVHSSRDVGNAVFKLAEYNCLTLSGTEILQDFERAGLDV